MQYTIPELKWEDVSDEDDEELKTWQATDPIIGGFYEFFEEAGKFWRNELGDESDNEVGVFFDTFNDANRYFEGLSLLNQHVKSSK